MKVTLTFVNAEQRISPKTGKPYTSVSIKTVEYGDRYLRGFGNRDNMNWQPGMQVHITDEEKPNKDPSKPNYLNFETLPASMGEVFERLAIIERHLGISAAQAPIAAPRAPSVAPQAYPGQGMPTHPGFLAGAQPPVPPMGEPALDDLPF